jgi:hypothetical protein
MAFLSINYNKTVMPANSEFVFKEKPLNVDLTERNQEQSIERYEN